MSKPKKFMWEIYVPANDNKGKKYKVNYHRQWDAKVRKIAGGLTILKTGYGQWVSEDGDLYIETVIPVRISCTKEEFEEILNITLHHYDQKAVLGFKFGEALVKEK